MSVADCIEALLVSHAAGAGDAWASLIISSCAAAYTAPENCSTET